MIGYFRIAQGVTGGDLLQAYCGSDITCVAGFDIFSVVRVHLQDTANSFSMALGCVEDAVSPVLTIPEYARKKQSLQHTGRSQS